MSSDQDKTRIFSTRIKPSSSQDPSKAKPKPPVDAKEKEADGTRIAAKRKAPDADGTHTVFGAARVQPPRANNAAAAAPVERAAEKINKPKKAANLLKNRFVLENVLGSGGMGVVYKAKDLLKVEAKDRDPYVAIKVLGEDFKNHPEAFIALQRESRKTQRIAHPNIVNVYDFDKDGDTVFMTMEYLEGTPLDKLIKKYRATGLPSSDAWQILEGICAALAYAHGQNIIHSDLKPGNIFVTHHNVVKVFDFGIARAVANAEQNATDIAEDRTVFDAGNLGALTPTYASLEMLEGETPDVRDDIYALGCIAYELFAGRHPFDRKNAKEALKEGLKPRRIESLPKYQWRIIESALALRRNDRIESVAQFWNELTKKIANPLIKWSIVLTFVGVVAAGVYGYLNWQPPQVEVGPSRGEIEDEIRLEFLQSNIEELLRNKLFDERWEMALWSAMQNLDRLVGKEDESYIGFRLRAYQLYLEQLELLLEKKEFQSVIDMAKRAERYTDDFQDLLALSESAGQELSAIEELARNKAEEDRLRLAQPARQTVTPVILPTPQEEVERQKREQYEIAEKNVLSQLGCSQGINMADLKVTIQKLRELDRQRYLRSEVNFVNQLVSCLEKIGRNFPDRALAARTEALEIFNNNAKLLALKIEQRDLCNAGLAGLGARGRNVCQDTLSGGIKTPVSVVIPGRNGLPAFAIGRYEVTVAEFNHFCNTSKKCNPINRGNASLPVTGVPIKLVQEYLTWLSLETGKKYRLPTVNEWRIAANADGKGLDANRNCLLNARGIQKGGALLNAEIGQQNGWGLVNHVGNAQEWVLGPEGQTFVVGGSYATEMEECTINWQRSSNGAADAATGFRVLRELVKN